MALPSTPKNPPLLIVLARTLRGEALMSRRRLPTALLDSLWFFLPDCPEAATCALTVSRDRITLAEHSRSLRQATTSGEKI
jgi:hypothetical protein